MNITVLYVGSSLLAPLKNAEREINRLHKLDLRVAAYNFGSPLSDDEWVEVERDLEQANVVFVIHVMDGENASRLLTKLKDRHDAVVVINCMPELMRRTRMGKLDVGAFAGWMARYTKSHKESRKRNGHGQYLKLIRRLPQILKFVPTAGALTDAKHYLYLFCYFLQPTPANIQSMLLYVLKHYVDDERLKRRKLRIADPENMPAVAIYHPNAHALFESFDDYKKWYKRELDPKSTIGLLLMRPQVVSKTTKHYDTLINSIESEGLSVIPALATFMDNREAVSKFFIENNKARVSQIVSLTGFSFVGGPAMNDSAAAAEFLRELNLPYRSAVSLDTQTIEAWNDSATGLNPVQAGMQIAIPEIDGATEPFIYGGIPARGQEP
ncbi:MAG TPA: cobaltochelatase subunit CobN, partial [Pyrinomonadaceae bacterium]|nr:cobaltochelatase subunit CobN [Pyrinomonadaceae bacterium]